MESIRSDLFGCFGDIFCSDNFVLEENQAENDSAKVPNTNGAEVVNSVLRKGAKNTHCLEGFKLSDSLDGVTAPGKGKVLISNELMNSEAHPVCDTAQEPYIATLSIHQGNKNTETLNEVIVPSNNNEIINLVDKNILLCNEPIGSFSTTLCSFNTMDKIKFDNHEKTHKKKESVTYDCTFCFRLFKTKSGANDHMRQVHEAPSMINNLCELCGFVYRNCTIKSHICNDSKPKKCKNPKSNTEPYQCEDCDYKCKFLSNLNRHVKSIHQKDIFYCEVSDSCNYKCNRVDNLLRHHKSHDSSLKNPPKMKSVKKMKCHANIVNSKNMYKICYICGDSVLNQDTHMLKVHKVSNFKCEVCDKSLLSKRSLVNHTKVKHQTKSEYICPFCEMKFKDSPTCKRHIKMHNFDENQMKQCPKCSYKTKYNFHLKSHLKIHEKKMIKCTICERCFKTNLSLSQHTKRNH